jgi:hypothetical protein
VDAVGRTEELVRAAGRQSVATPCTLFRFNYLGTLARRRAGDER